MASPISPTENDHSRSPLDVHGLSSSDKSQYGHDHTTGISQPGPAFFGERRESQILDPHELEEGCYDSGDSYSETHAMSNTRNQTATPLQNTEACKPLSSIPMHIAQQGSSDTIVLPPKKGSRAYRYARWNFGSVYKRIFTLAFTSNIAALVVLIAFTITGDYSLTSEGASTAVAANLLAALVVRNEHVVNTLFIILGTWPRTLPLRPRHFFAKVYSYGGIHSGCGVAATFWYIAFLVQITREYVSAPVSIIQSYVLFVSYGIVCLLMSILVFAHPRLRIHAHNWFECVHRFLGWSVILLFWAQVLLVAAHTAVESNSTSTYGMVLVINPVFWLLICITLLVIYPWSRLRLRDVEAEPLSDHCVKLNFDYRNAHYGQAVRLSDCPLKETHAFATIPNPVDLHWEANSREEYHHCVDSTCKQEKTARDLVQFNKPKGLSHAGKKGFSVVISNAGDWTKKIIQNPPKKIYTRGVPQYGVVRVAGMFEPVIIIATGSGIAPCLSLFVEKPDHPVRVIWSAPNPLETFGQTIIDTIYAVDPDANIIDTRKSGRPDLVKIAYRIWQSSRTGATQVFADDAAETSANTRKQRKNMGPCEAVVIISNQKVTRKVVYGLESRGVAAYGAIFDS